MRRNGTRPPGVPGTAGPRKREKLVTWVWIVIAVVVVLAVVGLLVMAANKKKQEQRRTQAEELRTDAHAQSASVAGRRPPGA